MTIELFRQLIREELSLISKDKEWDFYNYEMPIQEDQFVHFTPEDRAKEIIKSGKLLMRPPYKKFGIDAVAAISTVWGAPVPAVQSDHIDGNLVAILFKTATIPEYGRTDEVIWEQDVDLINPKIISVSAAMKMLKAASLKLPAGRDLEVKYTR